MFESNYIRNPNEIVWLSADVFKIRTILQPNYFGLSEIRMRSDFGIPLYLKLTFKGSREGVCVCVWKNNPFSFWHCHCKVTEHNIEFLFYRDSLNLASDLSRSSFVKGLNSFSTESSCRFAISSRIRYTDAVRQISRRSDPENPSLSWASRM